MWTGTPVKVQSEAMLRAPAPTAMVTGTDRMQSMSMSTTPTPASTAPNLLIPPLVSWPWQWDMAVGPPTAHVALCYDFMVLSGDGLPVDPLFDRSKAAGPALVSKILPALHALHLGEDDDASTVGGSVLGGSMECADLGIRATTAAEGATDRHGASALKGKGKGKGKGKMKNKSTVKAVRNGNGNGNGKGSGSAGKHLD